MSLWSIFPNLIENDFCQTCQSQLIMGCHLMPFLESASSWCHSWNQSQVTQIRSVRVFLTSAFIQMSNNYRWKEHINLVVVHKIFTRFPLAFFTLSECVKELLSLPLFLWRIYTFITHTFLINIFIHSILLLTIFFRTFSVHLVVYILRHCFLSCAQSYLDVITWRVNGCYANTSSRWGERRNKLFILAFLALQRRCQTLQGRSWAHSTMFLRYRSDHWFPILSCHEFYRSREPSSSHVMQTCPKVLQKVFCCAQRRLVVHAQI